MGRISLLNPVPCFPYIDVACSVRPIDVKRFRRCGAKGRTFARIPFEQTRPIMLAPPSPTEPLAPRRPLVILPTQTTWCQRAPLDLRGLTRGIGGSVLR